MESYIQISKINDFIFCPKSIYLHGIYDSFNEKTYHGSEQNVGKLNHKNIDDKSYSTAKKFLQGIEIYSEKYNICGKIDIYDSETKSLIERKTRIQKIYDGYKYQLYAQYFCMTEMGFEIKKLFLHSLKDNKRYEIFPPDKEETEKFEQIINKINKFNLFKDEFSVNRAKCEKCVYNNLC